MADITINFKVHVAWWLRWYLSGMVLMCRTMGTEPDMTKVERVIRRALTVHIDQA